MAAEQHYTPLGAILNANHQDGGDNVIEDAGDMFAPFETEFDCYKSDLHAAVADAKREAMHKMVCALYAARRKGMSLPYVLQALRDYRAEDSDDVPLAVAEFDASFWGCNG